MMTRRFIADCFKFNGEDVLKLVTRTEKAIFVITPTAGITERVAINSKEGHLLKWARMHDKSQDDAYTITARICNKENDIIAFEVVTSHGNHDTEIKVISTEQLKGLNVLNSSLITNLQFVEDKFNQGAIPNIQEEDYRIPLLITEGIQIKVGSYIYSINKMPKVIYYQDDRHYIDFVPVKTHNLAWGVMVNTGMNFDVNEQFKTSIYGVPVTRIGYLYAYQNIDTLKIHHELLNYKDNVFRYGNILAGSTVGVFDLTELTEKELLDFFNGFDYIVKDFKDTPMIIDASKYSKSFDDIANQISKYEVREIILSDYRKTVYINSYDTALRDAKKSAMLGFSGVNLIINDASHRNK